MAAVASASRAWTAGSICSSRIWSNGMGRDSSSNGFCMGPREFTSAGAPVCGFLHSRLASGLRQRIAEGARMAESVDEGQILWQPSDAERARSRMADYLAFLQRTRGLGFADYASALAWSVAELGDFWTSIAEYFAVQFHVPAAAGPSGALPRAHWFTGAQLNYAEHALRVRDDKVAVIARSESGARRVWTRAELAADVAR